MTKEQFKEVTKIYERIKQLKRILSKFQIYNGYRLSLIYDSCDGISRPVDACTTDLISDKLENHTKKLIQELNEEIKELNERIEEL